MTAVANTHTFAGGVFTSSEANTYIRDPILFLLNKPIAELRQTSTQTVTTGTWTSITFTTEDVDTDPTSTGGHSTSSNTSRFTAVYAGWYLCGGGVTWTVSATGARGTRWAVNGASLNASETWTTATSASGFSIAARAKRIFLTVGDYVELQAYQISGGNLDTVVSAEAASSLTCGWERNA